MRPRLTEAADKAASIGGIALPEKRVNQIAAEIYAKIDSLAGKYKMVNLTA